MYPRSVFIARLLTSLTLLYNILSIRCETLADYFPEIKGDLSRVSWEHAVNNKERLYQALKGEAMMLEADVILTVENGRGVPIMAHPPVNSSDLTLQLFIDTFMESRARKGIKLDFKSRDAFSASGKILEKMFYDKYVNFPVWLNADIVPGPVNASRAIVDPDYFLTVCVSRFPFATISVGWSTRMTDNGGGYTTDDVNRITEALNRNLVISPVTFSVRAALAAHSVTVLASLVESSVPGTTLTIWSSDPTDQIDFIGLKKLIKKLGRERVYLDMPKEAHSALQREDSSPAVAISSSAVGVTLMSLSLLYFAV